jgi:hypothetical protein
MATDAELKQLEKEVRRTKRIATDWASQLHDLVEDKLPAGFEELPSIAQGTLEACKDWRRAMDALEQATGTLAASETPPSVTGGA